MKVNLKDTPRKFKVGKSQSVEMKDCGTIQLEPDEQITFVTSSGTEYDLAKKSWGYYATPSLNGRLPKFGLRPALVKNEADQFFVLLTEKESMEDFEQYLTQEGLIRIIWLDEPEALQQLENLRY